MSTTEQQKEVERSSTSVHAVDLSKISATVHGDRNHAWINVGRTTFHFNSEADLVAFADAIRFAVFTRDRSEV